MGTTELLTTTQPRDWVAAVRAQAEAEGVNLSEWVGEALRAALPAEVEMGLSKRVGRAKRRSKAERKVERFFSRPISTRSHVQKCSREHS